MAPKHETRTLSVRVDRDSGSAYAFLADPRNFPKWASGLCTSIEKQGDAWIAETPYGAMTIRFTEKNGFGVLDHYVQPPSGAEIYVPMRVLAHGSGAEILLTLFRQPDMSDKKFEEDTNWVERDLLALKAVLEQ